MSSQVVLCLLGENGVKADRLEREKESKEQSISQLRSADVSLDVEEFEAVLALWFGVIVFNPENGFRKPRLGHSKKMFRFLWRGQKI